MLPGEPSFFFFFFFQLPLHPSLFPIYLSNVPRSRQVCQSFTKVPVDHLFRRWCLRDFDETSLGSHSSFQDLYKAFYADFGRYLSCYTRTKTALREIVAQIGPDRISLNPGLPEAEITAQEARLGVRLPLELRCAYRLHSKASPARTAVMFNLRAGQS